MSIFELVTVKKIRSIRDQNSDHFSLIMSWICGEKAPTEKVTKLKPNQLACTDAAMLMCCTLHSEVVELSERHPQGCIALASHCLFFPGLSYIWDILQKYALQLTALVAWM